METIVKINVKELKKDLKNLSDNQRFLKNQRKTENLVGERVEEPWVATYKHQVNREKLRLMYAAYGLLRGKSFSQTENKYSEEEHPLNEFKDQIDKIIESYEKLKENNEN